MVALSTNLSGNIEDLEENVKSLMEQSSNNYSSGNRSWKGYRCKVCGKEGAGNAIKDHIALCSKSNGSYDIKDFGTLSLIFSTSKYFRWKFQPCPSFFCMQIFQINEKGVS